MRTFIKSLLLFFLFCIVFYIVALITFPSILKKNLNFQKGSYGHLYSRLQEVKSVKNIDLLFLGSSHAYRGFDTRIFDSAGLQSFNLGSSAQAPIQTQLLINKYLSQLNPKLIVYEVNPLIFSEDGVESSLDLIPNDQISMATAKMSLQINNIKTYNALVYGTYRQFLNLDKNFREDSIKEKDRYIKGGFVEREISFFHHKKYKPKKIELNKTQLKFFDETLTYINKKGMKVILVQAPTTSALYKANIGNAEFDSIIESKKIPYFNFNKLMPLDDSLYFYDGHHLNQNGVRLFNSKLIEIIKKNNL